MSPIYSRCHYQAQARPQGPGEAPAYLQGLGVPALARQGPGVSAGPRGWARRTGE